uniref:Glucosaminyl (N-acetyl) transferase family member 7 n=1 Tax=Leptobrachium leishanense TaxID=445787 RepID=A0A8C5QWN3_9ANUR
MSQLGATKSGFILCVCVCIILFTFSGVKDLDEQKQYSPEIKECGFYPGELCTAIFEGKSAALTVGNVCQRSFPPSRDNGPVFLQTTTNCSLIIQNLNIITEPLSVEEADYPLAYIITIHKKLDMFVKLLRAIYAPQNIYCIHIDKKSSKIYSRTVRKLASCFSNIIVSSKQETVVYAGFSRLQADVNCMEDLADSENPWKHVINLCGQDFPIRTNREIVRYLKTQWNGRNLTPGVIQPSHMKYRTSLSYREFEHMGKAYVSPTATEKSGPPNNITIFFGTAYYALTRDFVRFVRSDKRAKDLLKWSRDTYSPDEHYWVTLNRLKGHYVRDICIYGLGDLQWIIESPHLFANKFDPGVYPLVTDCLERHYRLKVLAQAEVALDPNWYLQDNYTKKGTST